MAKWLEGWNFNSEVPGSNPRPCQWMDLCWVVPDSTPTRFCSVSSISTVVRLKTDT